MKSFRFALIWLPVAVVLGWIGCAIPWGKPTGFHGTGLPIPVVLWDKPKGSEHFLDYPNVWGFVQNPFVVYVTGLAFWGVYRGVRSLIKRR